MVALIVVQTLAIILLGVLVAGLLRSHAEILRRLHALDGGADTAGGDAADDHGFRVHPGLATPNEGFADAADLSGVTPWEEAIGVSVVGAGHHTLIAFLSSGCDTCHTFWNAFAEGTPHEDLPPGVRLVVVTHAPSDESLGATRDLAGGLDDVPVVMSNDAWRDYGVPGSPYFVLVDGPAGRVIGEGAATSWPQVADLIRRALADRPHAEHAALPLTPPGRFTSGRDRADRIDRELQAAGIYPGHPSLYGDPGDAPPEPDPHDHGGSA
ncbi:MAG TPA: hypothetical protein VIK95_01275 [Egibacteraceae bacterium]